MQIKPELIKQINQLPPLEKLQLAEHLLAELDTPNPEIDKIWATEAQSRWNASQNGEQQSVSYEEVMQKYK